MKPVLTGAGYLTSSFPPEQIKSATDNRGTFDAGNPDIYHQIIGERGAAKLDAADAGNRIGVPNGWRGGRMF
ncbi:MAG: hypothetical protein IJU98_03915 [Synergistaceae bacterium]|nr:hypothetical protein [Synergistaceae bacterium]